MRKGHSYEQHGDVLYVFDGPVVYLCKEVSTLGKVLWCSNLSYDSKNLKLLALTV